MTNKNSSVPQARGPADHCIRDQIVVAATEHFAHYGYEKTTVSELAKAIGFSKAYVYKFFDSKQAIGEVICTQCLNAILAAIDESMTGAETASERFRRLFKTIVKASVELFFRERKLYDVAAFSASERWQSAVLYELEIQQIIKQIVLEGRESGEFERKTPLDEVVTAVYLVMNPYLNPLSLKYNLDRADDAAVQLSNLVLRSLAP